MAIWVFFYLLAEAAFAKLKRVPLRKNSGKLFLGLNTSQNNHFFDLHPSCLESRLLWECGTCTECGMMGLGLCSSFSW